jgi:hypothetical protein
MQDAGPAPLLRHKLGDGQGDGQRPFAPRQHQQGPQQLRQAGRAVHVELPAGWVGQARPRSCDEADGTPQAKAVVAVQVGDKDGLGLRCPPQAIHCACGCVKPW